MARTQSPTGRPQRRRDPRLFPHGVGIGYSLHAGMVVVADGTDAAAERLQRVLTTDPGTGVMRHADAGYEIAVEAAKTRGVDIPMM